METRIKLLQPYKQDKNRHNRSRHEAEGKWNVKNSAFRANPLIVYESEGWVALIMTSRFVRGEINSEDWHFTTEGK